MTTLTQIPVSVSPMVEPDVGSQHDTKLSA